MVTELRAAQSAEERDLILCRDSRVRQFFGAHGNESDAFHNWDEKDRNGTVLNTSSSSFSSYSLNLAFISLPESDCYLLKCLVACGQQHLLSARTGSDKNYPESPIFGDEFRGNSGNGTGNGNGNVNGNGNATAPSSSSTVKDAFATLGSVIEGLGLGKNSTMNNLLSGLESPGVFPTQVMELLDWEGRYDKSPEKSFFHQFWESWDSPGLFPAGAIQLMDFEGRYEKSSENLTSEELQSRTSLLELVTMLRRLEKFYDAIGGIIGYQLASLELILAAEQEQRGLLPKETNTGEGKPRFLVPRGQNLALEKDFASQASIWGLQGLPEMGEIYPLGGAGDRLGLVDEKTGECLPVAMLPYCGRTLLQGLIRDLQAREYLHFRISGQTCITPIAIMTSAAKQNHQRVQALCDSHGWFGRGRENFKLFEQPLVPAVAAFDGRWLMSGPLTAVLKPGGHGVIWKLACDEGVFDWFENKGRKAAMVRQISNPMAGTDVTMLTLSGVGLRGNKKFGFASCDRNVGTAEGVNVLTEVKRPDGSWDYGVTCVEYTEFGKLGIADTTIKPGSLQSQFPANTNVLYVDLESVKHAASTDSKAALPGLIMNLKKPVKFVDNLGRMHSVKAGRLECTMQNIADSLMDSFSEQQPVSQHGDLSTFLLYNDRRKVTSSAKRRRKPDDLSLHQTPDGSFLDLNRNAAELFVSCGVKMPLLENNQCYLEAPPPFIVLWNPALGPLWDVVRQKVVGGSIMPNSEVQLEIAELLWRDVHVDGSLLIHAENILGEVEESEKGEQILHYGQRCGRCRLERVHIQNKGVDWVSPQNVFWQHKIQRLESIRIYLHGDAEFDARDVTLEGSHIFDVPAGYRLCVRPGISGVMTSLEPLNSKSGGTSNPSWEWQYQIEDEKSVKLSLKEN